MIVSQDSHLDHNLSETQIEFVKAKFEERDGFFIETVELPEELGTLPCALHGPLMGDDPVEEDEVQYEKRGERDGESRLVDRAPRPTRKLSVIAGPHGDESCVLYTAFGGPVSPKEPFDPSLKGEELKNSKAFWSEHALSL